MSNILSDEAIARLIEGDVLYFENAQPGINQSFDSVKQSIEAVRGDVEKL